jgi:hypothetical protein
MLKRDDLSISLELKVYSIQNNIASVFGLVHYGVIKFAFPASENVGTWYCHLSSLIMSIGMFRELIHTFTLSVYRYVFIIHRENISTDKLRNRITWAIFVTKWLAVCMFSAKFVIFNKDEFVSFSTRVCMGDYKSIQPTNNADISQLENVLERVFYRVTKTDDRALITIFGNVNGHAAYPLKAFCVIVDIFIIATSLNIMEGFLYTRIANFMKS